VSRAVSQQKKPSTRKLAPQRAPSRPRPAERRGNEDSDDLRRTVELAALIETASDAVVGVSPAGVITRWGDGAARFFGYASEEALGKRVAILAPPSRSEEALGLLARLQAGQQVDRIETERVTKDGVAKKVLLSVTAIWGRDGKLAGSIGVFRDLSPQRDAEEALQASERRYHSVVEALGEGIVMQDGHGRIITCNKSAERILGADVEQLVQGTANGETAGLVLLREDGSIFPRQEHPSVVCVRTGEIQRDVVMGVETPDGPTRWISVNACPLVRPGEDEPYAAVTSFTDVTELRSTLAELHEARFEDLRRLAIVAEYRDDDTNKHTERVARTGPSTAPRHCTTSARSVSPTRFC
jgi:PAS domain S-box-containing protein